MKKRLRAPEKSATSPKRHIKELPIVASKEICSKELPRHKVEQLRYCYGLDQVELGHTKPDQRHAFASQLWESILRHTWRKFHPPLHDYGFIPSSLSSFSIRVVRKHGVPGIHYAEGWEGLYNMYVMFGDELKNYQPEPTNEMLERGSKKPQLGGNIRVKEEDIPEREATDITNTAECKDSTQNDPLMLLSSVAERTGGGWENRVACSSLKCQQDENNRGEVDLDALATSSDDKTIPEDDTDETNTCRRSRSESFTSVTSSLNLPRSKRRRVRRPPERFASPREVSVSEMPLILDTHEKNKSTQPPPFLKQASPPTPITDTPTETLPKTESVIDISNIADGVSNTALSIDVTKDERNLLEERLRKMERRVAQLEQQLMRMGANSVPLVSPTLTPSLKPSMKTLSDRIDSLEMQYTPNQKCRTVTESNTGIERVKRLEIILFDCVQSGGLLSRVERMEKL